jgi:hypothetical protein
MLGLRLEVSCRVYVILRWLRPLTVRMLFLAVPHNRFVSSITYKLSASLFMRQNIFTERRCSRGRRFCAMNPHMATWYDVMGVLQEASLRDGLHLHPTITYRRSPTTLHRYLRNLTNLARS